MGRLALVFARSVQGCSLALALIAATPPKQASPKVTAACLENYEKGQRERLAGHFRDAHDILIACARDECPAQLRRDCARWLVELAEETPSVVFAATSAEGRDLVDVRVSIDGVGTVDQLDGKAVTLDPGAHWFRFEAEGLAPVEKQVLIRQREQGRHVTAEFAPAASPRAGRVIPYALGGVGIASLAAFAYFGLDGRSKQSELDDRGCKPRCSQDDVDAMDRSYRIANIALGVSVISMGAATVLMLRDTGEDPPRNAGALSVGVAASPGILFGGVRGAF